MQMTSSPPFCSCLQSSSLFSFALQAESRIGVIFDLDETLLLANTLSSLSTKIDQAKRMKQSSEMELSKFSYLSSLHPAQRNPEDESSVKLIQVKNQAK